MRVVLNTWQQGDVDVLKVWLNEGVCPCRYVHFICIVEIGTVDLKFCNCMVQIVTNNYIRQLGDRK